MTRKRRGEALVLVAILVVALALRVIYLLQVREHPLFTVLMGDPALYHAQARDILSGVMVPEHAYFHSSPLYPFFIAIVRALGGTSLHALRLVQSCVGVVSVYLVFVLGRLTVGRRAGLIAALLAAVYVPFIFFEAEVLEITIVIAAVLGSLAALVAAGERGGAWRAALAGALLGVAGMGKPNILLFAPVGAVWLMLDRPPGEAGASGSSKTRRRAAARVVPAVLYFVAAGLVVLPATVHNYRTEGDLIPVSSNGGINFFIGNHAGSPGVFQVPPEMRFDLRLASKEVAERATGRELSAGEVSDYWARQTLGQIRAHPGRWLRLLGRKFVLFWNHYEIPNHYNLYFVRQFAPVLRLPVGTFGVVAPLGLFGIGLALVRRKRVGPLVAFGLTFMVSVLLFFITGRYRLAVVPVLLVGAGYAVDAVWGMLRARDGRRLLVAAVCVAVLTAGINVNTIEFGFAQMHNSVGTIYGRRGDMEGAAVEFAKALAANPADLSSRYNLGLALLELGRHGEAAEQFERAVGQFEGYHEAWLGLARARAGEGRTEGALRALDALSSLNPPPLVAAQAEALAASLGTPVERTGDGRPESEESKGEPAE